MLLFNIYFSFFSVRPSCNASVRAHGKIKWLSTPLCIFHHACLFLPPSLPSPSMMNLSGALVEASSCGIARRARLIDGRQWLSPPESREHFCVVSPLKVLLSLLREKTLFVYSRCDGGGLTAPAEEEKESPAGAPVYLSLRLTLLSVSSCLSSSTCFAAFRDVRNQRRVQTVGPQISFLYFFFARINMLV